MTKQEYQDFKYEITVLLEKRDQNYQSFRANKERIKECDSYKEHKTCTLCNSMSCALRDKESLLNNVWKSLNAQVSILIDINKNEILEALKATITTER